jgi:ureidoacrylate peracid hydrolase
VEVIITAEPEEITLDTERSALIVVDMQNSFCKKGGMMDFFGKLNEHQAQRVISACQKIIPVARTKGIPICYLRMTYGTKADATLGPDSPFYWKEKGLAAIRRNPELKGKFLTQGTWDWEIVDELKPETDDIIINKARYSGFVNTELDEVLKKLKIKYLVFIGLFTNICVESTARDAFFHEYFPILIRDACGNTGPEFIQESTIWNIQSAFGWISTADDLIKSLR